MAKGKRIYPALSFLPDGLRRFSPPTTSASAARIFQQHAAYVYSLCTGACYMRQTTLLKLGITCVTGYFSEHFSFSNIARELFEFAVENSRNQH